MVKKPKAEKEVYPQSSLHHENKNVPRKSPERNKAKLTDCRCLSHLYYSFRISSNKPCSFFLFLAYHDVGQAGFEPTTFLPRLPQHCFCTTVPVARFFCNSSVYVYEPVCVFIVIHPQISLLILVTDSLSLRVKLVQLWRYRSQTRVWGL